MPIGRIAITTSPTTSPPPPAFASSGRRWTASSPSAGQRRPAGRRPASPWPGPSGSSLHPEVPSWSRILVADDTPLTPLASIGTRTGSYLGARQGDLVKAVGGLSDAGSGRDPSARRVRHAGGGRGPRRNVGQQRAERDRRFRVQVLAAYGGRCALTGLAIRTDLRNEPDPAGLEAEAAHIRPVTGRHGGETASATGCRCCARSTGCSTATFCRLSRRGGSSSRRCSGARRRRHRSSDFSARRPVCPAS